MYVYKLKCIKSFILYINALDEQIIIHMHDKCIHARKFRDPEI